MKIDRLLSIIILLLNRSRVSAEELAARFEVTVRTIYRDMDEIGSAGIPIVSYQGANGGYGILENYRIDRQVLNIDEIQSIINALKSVPGPFEERESGLALEKITNLLPEKERERDKSGKIIFDSMPWGYEKKVITSGKIIYQSIRSSKLLKFDYRGWKNEDLTRVVEPVTLVFKGFSWYLFAFCRLRNDFRFFKLSRISNIECLNENFKPRQADYHNYTRWEENEKSGIEYKLKFLNGNTGILSEFFDPSELASQPDGSVLVRTNYPDQDWVKRFLLTFGESLEVLEPASARKEIKDTAEKILKIYSA
jgi:predicted DNA-binding transcriptional regulator YafY